MSEVFFFLGGGGGVGVGTFNGSEVEDMAQERASSFFMTLSVIQQRSVRV